MKAEEVDMEKVENESRITVVSHDELILAYM